jgi:hypothetical protein
MTSYQLFLDDVRDPPTKGSWVVARSYEDFKTVLREKGAPDLVAFDHDLGEFRTGVDCAKFLIDMDLFSWEKQWNGIFQIHSDNPIGVQNIKFDLECYLRLRDAL